jgi:hypothetical protein
VTKEGLLLRPHVIGLRRSLMNGVVRVGWGKVGRVEEVDVDVSGHAKGGVREEEDWRSSVVVCGIVGILELTFGESPLYSFNPLK